MIPSFCSQLCNICEDALFHQHLCRHFLQTQDLRFCSHLFHTVKWICGMPVPKHVFFALKIRVSDGQSHQETVQLCLRQQLCSGSSDLILCRDDQKRSSQRMDCSVHCHLPLLHCLQKSRLCTAGGPVDLIRQHDIRIGDRSRHVYKGSCLLLIHGKPNYVAGQDIRRKLDACIFQSQRLGKCHRQCRFSYSWNIIQQNMSICQNRHQHFCYDSFLSNNDFIDFIVNRIQLSYGVFHSISLPRLFVFLFFPPDPRHLIHLLIRDHDIHLIPGIKQFRQFLFAHQSIGNRLCLSAVMVIDHFTAHAVCDR